MENRINKVKGDGKYVYIVRCGSYYKIGISNDPWSRVASMQTGNPYPLREQLETVLTTLTPREQRVLTLRFGIGDGTPRTLEEVGKVFSVTRERVRQIEAKALRKMRHPTRSRKLPMALLWACEPEDILPAEIEASLHDRYKHKRVCGEWYELNNEDIKEILNSYEFISTEGGMRALIDSCRG